MDLSNVLFVTDLDGSILNRKKELSHDDRVALDEFVAQGGKFTIATGRSLQAAEHYIQMLSPTLPVLLYNGCLIYDYAARTILQGSYLPSSAPLWTRLILDRFPDLGCEVLLYDNVYVPQDNDEERKHYEICGITPLFAHISAIPQGNWFKVLFAYPPDKIPELNAYCRSLKCTDVDFVSTERHFYEMLPHNISKGKGLSRLVRLCFEKKPVVYALGDYDNDIELLKAADHSFAPSNALDLVKDIAGTVLSVSCDENPFSAVYQHILNDCKNLQKERTTHGQQN